VTAAPTKPKPADARRARPRSPGVRATTLADVASGVGVSLNTVSRSLRAPHTVRPELRRRIERELDRLHYVPNRLAGGLAGQHTGIVGVVITSLFYSEFAALVDEMQNALAEAGLHVMIGNSRYDPEEELRLVRAMLSWRPAALALVGTDHHPRARALIRRAGRPVVELWDCSDRIIDSAVGMDHRAIGYAQAAHLVDVGCRRIGFVGAVREHDYRAAKRLDGVRAAVRERLGGALPTALAAVGGHPDLGERLARELLAREPALDGIVTNGDIMAFGVLRALRATGRAVPGDVAVIGFGDNVASACVEPPLTTVDPPRAEIGRLAAAAILARIDGNAPRREVVAARLLVRASTDRAAARASVAR
jgi:LacI family gluconate utilization system Gnt-I transcriptional repressor